MIYHPPNHPSYWSNDSHLKLQIVYANDYKKTSSIEQTNSKKKTTSPEKTSFNHSHNNIGIK